MMHELVLNMHLTERCNYHCSYCFGKWGLAQTYAEIFEDETAGPEILRSLVVALRSLVRETPLRVTFVGGEPTLVSSLPRLVDECRDLGVRTAVITNGLLFRRYSM